MFTKQQKYFILIPLLIVGSLLWDQWNTKHLAHQSHIIGWKDHLLILEPNKKPVLWGDESEESKLYTKSILSFGSNIPPHTALDTTSITNHLVNNTRILFIPKNIETNTYKLPNTSLKSDWWVLENTVIPEYIPFPSTGILFIGSHKPGKSLITFAKENNLPLVSVNETQAFWLRKDASTWVLKVE